MNEFPNKLFLEPGCAHLFVKPVGEATEEYLRKECLIMRLKRARVLRESSGNNQDTINTIDALIDLIEKI